jgi:hypothetical protein
MTISLEGLPPSVDHSKFYSRVYNATKVQQYTTGQNLFGYNSAPPTSYAHCPTCAKPISDPLMFYGTGETDNSSLGSSPLVVPMGPLAAAAFESGMSAVEELKLLKAQVQDVARVCNAVARGDLSQKITVPVQGVVMVQLKDVINTMVCAFAYVPLGTGPFFSRLTNLASLRKRLHVSHKKSAPKGKHFVPFVHSLPSVGELPSVWIFGSLKPFPVNLVGRLSFSTSKAHGVN